MKRRTVSGWVCGLITLVIAPLSSPSGAGAQSINIDFGQPDQVPSESYAGAGAAGVWNGIEGTEFTQYSGFLAVDGSPTQVTLTNIGGSALWESQTALPADLNSLLSDYLVTENPALETCLFFHGLQNGMYRVTVYGWFPDDPFVESYVTVDQSLEAGQTVGGAWAGVLEPGIQFTQHLATVTQGDLYPHSGIPPVGGGSLAVLNAIQIERLPEPLVSFVRGDVNQDGSIDVGDVTSALSLLFEATPNTCEDAVDANADGALDIGDPIHVISYLFVGGASPAPPFDRCGTDPFSDLGCEAYSGCP